VAHPVVRKKAAQAIVNFGKSILIDDSMFHWQNYQYRIDLQNVIVSYFIFQSRNIFCNGLIGNYFVNICLFNYFSPEIN